MSRLTHHTTGNGCRSGSTLGPLRRQMVHLRRDIDLYERLYSTWQQGRRQRERQTEVRLHVIEAQLARLAGSDTIRISRSCSPSSPVSPSPILYPIGAYRC